MGIDASSPTGWLDMLTASSCLDAGSREGELAGQGVAAVVVGGGMGML